MHPSLPPAKTERNLGPWLVVAGAMLWGTTGTAQALAPESATSIAIGTLRLLLGGALMLLWARLRSADLHIHTWPRLPLLVGIVAVAAYQVGFFEGVARAGVAVGTIVGIGSAPIFAGMIGYFIYNERLSRRWFTATALALAGCALLTFAGDSGDALEGGVDTLGLLLAISAGASYAIYTAASKSLLATYTPDAVMAVFFSGGALLLAPLLLGQSLAWVADPAGALVIVHLGLMTVAVAYGLFARGLMRVPAAVAVTLTLAEPLTAGLLGVLLLGERLSLAGWLGVGLLLLGLWWLVRRG